MKRRNALILFVILAIVLLALDRITKNIAIEVLTSSDPIVFLPAFLDFALVYNTGAAFGVLEGGGVIFIGVAIIALIVIIIYLFKARELHMPVVIALSMISAGALGNAYDRAVNGAVPDFIHTLFVDFPVFNIADCCLTIGELLLIVTVAIYWFGPKSRDQATQEAAGLTTGGTTEETTRETDASVTRTEGRAEGTAPTVTRTETGQAHRAAAAVVEETELTETCTETGQAHRSVNLEGGEGTVPTEAVDKPAVSATVPAASTETNEKNSNEKNSNEKNS